MKIDFIGFLENFYLRLPNLNTEIKELVVKILPYLSLVFGLMLTVASILEIIGTPVLSVFTYQGRGLPLIQNILLPNVIGIAQGLLMIFAFSALLRHKQKGWRLLFWSQILWIIASVISFSPSLLFGIVLLYPFFQVKSYYR
jgi:hypothetical protein